jgi:hypothetical protein
LEWSAEGEKRVATGLGLFQSGVAEEQRRAAGVVPRGGAWGGALRSAGGDSARQGRRGRQQVGLGP